MGVAAFPIEQNARAPIRAAGQRPVTGDDGAWCPIVRPQLFVLRRRTGKFVLTDLGIEKLCARCREYWPFDTEFWYASPGKRDGVFNWCKACFREQSRRLAGVPRGR